VPAAFGADLPSLVEPQYVARDDRTPTVGHWGTRSPHA